MGGPAAVSDDELRVNAVCVVREFHDQVCAKFVLSNECATVPEVRDESAPLAAEASDPQPDAVQP